jgi:hypothetical protein
MRKFLCTSVLLLAGFGCANLGYQLFGVGSQESPRWPGLDTHRLWETLQEAVNDYYDIRLADDEEMYLETEWKESLGPMYKSGKRFRVRAWVRMDEEVPGPYVEITVDREINTNLERPLSEAEADWSRDWDQGGRDPSREKRILWLIGIKLKKTMRPSKKVLDNKPSKYREDPVEKAEEDLWGKGEGEKGRREKGPGGKKDLWK